MYPTPSKNNDRLARPRQLPPIGQPKSTPGKGVNRNPDCIPTYPQRQSLNVNDATTDDLARLIAHAEHLFRTDDDRSGQHFLIGLELRRLDFARRQFGPRFGDAQHKPTLGATS